MTPEQWARILADLHEEDEQRRAALLAMSDEDWVADGERGWIRKAACREQNLKPDGFREWNYDSYSWSYSLQVSLIPAHVRPKMKNRGIEDGADGREGNNHTHAYPGNYEAWLDLLRAVSREGAR